MRIRIWGINYDPEPTGIGPYTADLARWLAHRGHTVDVVSTFPYYPDWRKDPADARRLFRTDPDGAVRVHRVWHYVPPADRLSAPRRMLHEASFVAAAWLRGLTLPRPDVLLAILPPLAAGVAALAADPARPVPVALHVQDLQPEAAVRLGLLRPGPVLELLRGAEALAYRGCAGVSGITQDMVAWFRERGVAAERTAWLPNWYRAGPALGPDLRPRGAALARGFGIADDRFLALYSGNLGAKQGLEAVVAAGRRLAQGNARVRLHLAGDGASAGALDAGLAAEPCAVLSRSGLLPAEDYAALLARADVALVTQRAGTGRVFFPSKLLSVLAAGRPVVALADPGGALERAVQESQAGWTLPPGDGAGLAALLARLAGDPAAVAAAAAAARHWVTPLAPENLLPSWEPWLARLAGLSPATAGRTV